MFILDSGASRPPVDGAVPFVPTTARLGVSEQDLAGMVMGTPLFESLNEIESKLRNNIGEGGVAGAKGGRSYIDIQDAQWLCGGDLVPVDINELSPTNFVVYRFGVFVADMLKQAMKVPDVTLLLASNLPNNDYHRNAFRNSFFFEHARKILFVRQERMHSVGDFVVVIMHCLAHIKVDNLVDDNNPLFLREFYKVFQLTLTVFTVCEKDMYSSSIHLISSRLTLSSYSISSPLRCSLSFSSFFSFSYDLVSSYPYLYPPCYSFFPFLIYVLQTIALTTHITCPYFFRL